MKKSNIYFAPEVEIIEVITEQGIAFSDPGSVDLILPDLGDEEIWDV